MKHGKEAWADGVQGCGDLDCLECYPYRVLVDEEQRGWTAQKSGPE
jgi:hypothetical protein